MNVMILGAMVFAQVQTEPVQPSTAATTVAVAEPAPQMVRLPALTPLRLRVVGEVSSKTHIKGDKVPIVLAEALRLSDTLIIPAGTRGVAEVIHSAKGGMGGKAGELLIAARSLDLSPDVRIPLRSFRLAPVAGKNNEGLATGLTVVGGVAGGLVAMAMVGGSARIPDGSEAFAKTAADIELPVAQLQATSAGTLLAR